jgi:hypothetical protein
MSGFRRWWHGLLTSPLLFGELPEQRAIQLLKQNLSPVQRQQYEWDRSFEVIGGRTGRRYRIRHGYQMNVEQLDPGGRCTHLLCFMPQGGLAIGDILLGQKLGLELFEDEALRVANCLPREVRRMWFGDL